MAVDHTVDLCTLASHGVLIDLLQRRRCGVSHSLHGVLVRDIQREHDRGVIMSEIVETTLKAKGIARINEFFRYSIRLDRNDELAFTRLVPHLCDDESGKLDLSLTLDSLGSLLYNPLTVFVLDNRSSNLHRVFLQIDVAEFQTADLGAAHTSTGAEKNSNLKPLAFDLLKQPLHIRFRLVATIPL